MAINKRRQLCATKRKRLVHDRRKKIVDRRGLFYKQTIEDEASLSVFK